MNNQKRLIAAFRNFVDKVFLPSFKKTDQQFLQWNRFNQQLGAEMINYDAVYQYVDAIVSNGGQNTLNPSFERRQIPAFKKKREETDNLNNESGGFNPSKTFGGERARMMFIKGQMDDFGDKRENGSNNNLGFGGRPDDGRNRNFTNNTQNILPGLQRLCKTFLQNQQRIENMFNNYANLSPNQKYS